MKLRTLLPAGALALALSVTSFEAAMAMTAAEIDTAVNEAVRRCHAEVKGCKTADAKALGILVFPSVQKAGLVVGGSYGEGALRVGGKTVGYYSTSAASIGLQAGYQDRSEILMFMSKEALDDFQASSGWEVGGNASVAVIDDGLANEIDTVSAEKPVIAFIFGQEGLMADLSLEGAKISKIDR
jgi:lipid-binding SYLF domain-containing protein